VPMPKTKPAEEEQRPAGARTVDGLCGICPAGCWVRVHRRDGRMESVEPLPDHPMGIVCTIGKHSPRIVHDPDRLRYPMRRVGKKGSGEFERIGWDAAFEILVERLQAVKHESGPEAAAIYTGRGSFDLAMCDLYQPDGVSVSSAASVLFPFGSPNTLGVGALCYVSFAMIAPDVTMGETYITMDTDLEPAELIVVWGANPATDSPPLAHRQILQAAARGADVVVIDPRRHGTAIESGAEWIPIRPGTDGALALGLIQVMLVEESHDEAFARDWTVGFEELAGMVQHYRPEVVQDITGVPAATVRRLARRIAGARGACPVMYSGLEYSDSGVQAIRAVFTAWALAGQLDVPGGLLFRMKENVFPQNRTRLVPNENMSKALGRDRFPVYSQYRGESHAIALPRSVLEGDPYRIRALIALGGSIITSWPNPSLWKRTLGALDFLACIDRYPTADAAYADLVLPACTQYEVTSYMRYGPMFKIRERLVEPVGEARNDFLILAELARRLGYGHLYPQTEDEILRHALDGTGFTLEEVRAAGGSVRVPTVMMEYRKWEKGRLRPDGQPGFDTPSGKFEIASSILTEHGYEPLPVYTEPQEGPLARPDLAERFPLVFNSGARTRHDFRSQHHGVQGLSDKHAVPLVTLNEEDAAERGIGSGDRVWVETPRGKVRFVARVTDRIVRGAIDANQGGGGPLGPPAWQECNVNELTDLERYDPISGFPVFKALLCQVSRVDGSGDRVAVVPTDPDAEVESSPSASRRDRPRREVYLDHGATTPVDPEVLQAMLPFLERECGNPSSIHRRGAAARSPVEEARRRIASVLGCTARRVVFVSCGTEANNTAIKGVASLCGDGKRHIVTSAVEHPAVLATCRHLESRGFDLTVLPVDSRGRVDPESLAQAIRTDTALVSIMLANNEVGTIQPVAEMASVARSRGVLFHTDAVQALGRIPVDVEELGVDLLSLSAHKAHGPKGVGALYVRKDVELERLLHGGDQERGLRAGTENVAGVVGFGKACELAMRRLLAGEMDRVGALRDRLEAGIAAILPEAVRHGHPDHRLPVTSSIGLPRIRGESLVLFLDRDGISFSSGSACKSGDPEPSRALLAMGMTSEQAHCTVRFSLGVGNTEEEIDYVLDRLAETIETARTAVRFVSCR
jgi:cysteine desulfurase NifS